MTPEQWRKRLKALLAEQRLPLLKAGTQEDKQHYPLTKNGRQVMWKGERLEFKHTPVVPERLKHLPPDSPKFYSPVKTRDYEPEAPTHWPTVVLWHDPEWGTWYTQDRAR